MIQAKKPRRLNPISIVLILGLVAFILYIVFFINPTQVIGILSKINLVYFAGAFVAYSLFALFSSGLAEAAQLLICKNQQTKSITVHVGWIVF